MTIYKLDKLNKLYARPKEGIKRKSKTFKYEAHYINQEARII